MQPFIGLLRTPKINQTKICYEKNLPFRIVHHLPVDVHHPGDCPTRFKVVRLAAYPYRGSRVRTYTLRTHPE